MVTTKLKLKKRRIREWAKRNKLPKKSTIRISKELSDELVIK